MLPKHLVKNKIVEIYGILFKKVYFVRTKGNAFTIVCVSFLL